MKPKKKKKKDMKIATPSPCQSDIPLLNTKLTRTKTRKINGRSPLLSFIRFHMKNEGQRSERRLRISDIVQFINPRSCSNHKRHRSCYSSCSFTAKFLGPFCVSLEVFMADCRPGAADRLDKIFEHKWGFKELVRFDVDPGHLHCTLISR